LFLIKFQNYILMTFIKQKKIATIVGTAIFTIAMAFGGNVFASHSFETGAAAGVLPVNTHIRLDGMTLESGSIFPLYDSSPNYIAGHFLISAPCAPVTEGDDTMRPTVTVLAGHVDEMNEATHMEKIPLFYIAAVSNAPNSCIWHAHVPDPVNGGSPRVTDIDLINLSGEPIAFNPGNVVDINIQQVLGTTTGNEYTGGPTVILDDDNGVYNPIYDLNDDDHENDGLGHSSQTGGS
jgi:hypothetical protein